MAGSASRITNCVRKVGGGSVITRWRYGKIAGELLKLDFDASESTVRNVLKTHDILPAPVPHTPTEVIGSVARRQVLGGIINDYYRTPTGLALLSI